MRSQPLRIIWSRQLSSSLLQISKLLKTNVAPWCYKWIEMDWDGVEGSEGGVKYQAPIWCLWIMLQKVVFSQNIQHWGRWSWQGWGLGPLGNTILGLSLETSLSRDFSTWPFQTFLYHFLINSSQLLSEFWVPVSVSSRSWDFCIFCRVSESVSKKFVIWKSRGIGLVEI